MPIMALFTEKLCRKHGAASTGARGENRGSAWLTWVKKRANRLMRRAAKVDPEGAPMKRGYRGWSD